MMKLIQNHVASSGIIRIRIQNGLPPKPPFTTVLHGLTAGNEKKKTFCIFAESKTNIGQ